MILHGKMGTATGYLAVFASKLGCTMLARATGAVWRLHDDVASSGVHTNQAASRACYLFVGWLKLCCKYVCKKIDGVFVHKEAGRRMHSVLNSPF